MSANPVLYQRPQIRQIRMSTRREPTRRGGWNTGTYVKIYLGLIGACGLLLSVFSPAVALILSGILIGAPLLALGIVEARRDSLWLNPMSLFLVYLGTQLGPAAVWEGTKLITDGSLNFPSLRIPAADIATGYFLTLVGTCAMSLGLRAFRPTPGSQARPTGWKTHWIFVLFVVGIAATYRPSAFLFLGVFGGVLQCGCMAVLLAFAFSRTDGRNLASEKLLFSAGVLIYVAACFFGDNSSKSYTMLAFLPVIVLLVRHQKYRKWIPAGSFFLAVLYLGIVAPAVNNSRSLKGKDSYQKLMTGLYSASPFYTDKPLLLSMQDQLDQFMGRVFEMPQVAGFMVNEVRRSGFQLGGTMNNLYYALVPRIVWAGKPLVSRG